jgi:hypothetical protein
VKTPAFTWPQQVVYLAVGAVLSWMPVIGWVIGTLQTLVHEIGHAVASWFFARPAVPAFDFSQGGGFTIIRDRSTLMLVLILFAWAWLAWMVRFSKKPLIAVGVGAAAWILCMLTGLDEPIFSLMGHGGVYAFAAIFLMRALTGLGVVYPGEDKLYGAVAWALWWKEVAFSFSTLTDAATQNMYLRGKRGVDNDLVTVSQSLGCSLGTSFVLHLLAGIAVMGGVYYGFLWWRRRCLRPQRGDHSIAQGNA